MATNTAEPVRTARPRPVELALYAIVARCVLAIAAALALFGARGELSRNLIKLHPDWSPATLSQHVDSGLRTNLVLSVVYVVLVLLIAKFIRDGRNWARWLFALFSFLVTGDVLRVTGFFTGENVAFRLLSGLTGLAAVAAIVLLFLPSASGYFRPAGKVAVSPLRMLLGGRGAAVRAGTAEPGAARPAAVERAVSLAKPTAGSSAVGQQPAGGKKSGAGRSRQPARPAPKAKSRRQGNE